jgi:hypothetical protein
VYIRAAATIPAPAVTCAFPWRAGDPIRETTKRLPDSVRAPASVRWGLVRRLVLPALCLLAAVATAACGDEADEDAARNPATRDPGPVHVHGLGVNPADGALFVATHTGLFRAASGETRARRVGDRYQDTMGFTVTGPNRFLGSGHPDGRENLPPFLGLIRSDDAGRTWEPVSLLGERDFHVLEASGTRIYGYGSAFDSGDSALLVSDDVGRTWTQQMPPEPLISLAVNPGDRDHVIASGERALYESADAGGGWRAVYDEAGLVAWTAPDALFLVDSEGTVRRSSDAGRIWEAVGEVGGQPAALDSAGKELLVGLHDGTIWRSRDGGERWQLRSRP